MSYQQMISAWRDRALALSFSFRARLLEKLQIVMPSRMALAGLGKVNAGSRPVRATYPHSPTPQPPGQKSLKESEL